MEEERKIEKWLRSYARKRRSQAKDSFGLHPATRRLLQDEIARKGPAPEEDDSLSLWEVLRQQWTWLLAFTACIFLVATIFMPAVYKAREKARNTLGLAQLKQVGAAVQMSAANNQGRLPPSLDDLTNGYLAKDDLIVPKSGQPIVYVGAGKNLHGLSSNTVLAYSENNKDTRDVLFANGRTEMVDRKKFEEVTNQDLSQAVAMNSAGSLPPGSSPLNARQMASPPTESAAPSVAFPSAAPPPPPAPTVAVAIPPPLPEANAMTAATEQPQPTSASSDLAINSAGAQPPTMAPPTVTANQPFAATPARMAFKSPAEPAARPNALQNFQNNITPSQAVPVLSNFQVQQNGNALRIVDQDGSVYSGSWRLANRAANTRNQPTPAPSARSLEDNLQAAQNYLFRVHGMNRTLRQSVVFTGSLLGNFALSQNAQQSFGGIGGSFSTNQPQVKSALTNQTAQLPWSNLRIAGTAVVNRTNHIEVNASPVVPTKQN
jgi:hypothetical protein